MMDGYCRIIALAIMYAFGLVWGESWDVHRKARMIGRSTEGDQTCSCCLAAFNLCTLMKIVTSWVCRSRVHRESRKLSHLEFTATSCSLIAGGKVKGR